MRRSHAVLSVGLLAVVAVALVIVRAKSAPDPDSNVPSAATPSVLTSRATFGTFVERVAAHGRVGPPSGSDAKLAFAGSGVLTNITVRVGQAVSAGQLLAQYGGADVAASAFDAAQARARAAQSHLVALQSGEGSAQSDRAAALAAVHQSQAKVALDERALFRAHELYSGGVIAQKDVESAGEQLALDRADERANESKLGATSYGIGDALTQARADYASALSDATSAQRALENTALRAPSSGVVVALLRHLGESVDPGTPVIELGPAATSDLTLTVAGGSQHAVQLGDPVDFNVLARVVRGHGQVVGVVPNVDPATQATTVLVSGVPPDAVSGDAVDATIVVGQRRGIIVPTSAVVQDPQSGKMLVFVREQAKDGSSQFVARTVEAADGDDQTTLLDGGLRGGETIATQGAFDLLAPSGS
jgi:multidrug resistance efflux pump